jgi:hypothetical protein
VDPEAIGRQRDMEIVTHVLDSTLEHEAGTGDNAAGREITFPDSCLGNVARLAGPIAISRGGATNK